MIANAASRVYHCGTLLTDYTVNFDNIRIVLVATTHPGNIGATARAMKNMGLGKLVLGLAHDAQRGVA